MSTMIQSYEAGKAIPKKEFMEALSFLTDIPVETLLHSTISPEMLNINDELKEVLLLLARIDLLWGEEMDLESTLKERKNLSENDERVLRRKHAKLNKNILSLQARLKIIVKDNYDEIYHNYEFFQVTDYYKKRKSSNEPYKWKSSEKPNSIENTAQNDAIEDERKKMLELFSDKDNITPVELAIQISQNRIECLQQSFRLKEASISEISGIENQIRELNIKLDLLKSKLRALLKQDKFATNSFLLSHIQDFLDKADEYNMQQLNIEHSTNSPTEELQRWHELKEKGIITKEEFEFKKQQLLNI